MPTSITYSIGKYLKFSKREKAFFLATVFFSAFILTFKDWGVDSFDIFFGLSNLLVAAIFTLLFLFLHVVTLKACAIYLGYDLKYDNSIPAIFIATTISFLSFGTLAVFVPGAFSIKMIPYVRLGAFRHDTSIKDMAKIGFAGVLANLLAMVVLFFLYYFFRSDFVFNIVLINFLIAVYSLLPIPRSPGWHILYNSRWQFVLVFVTILVFGLLLRQFGLWSLVIGLTIGITTTLFFNRIIEQKN